MMRNRSPPWQVLDLVAHRLGPESLATAACVCKSWSIAMSADHLWHPICAATYPSLSNLHPAAAAPIPYRKLFFLGRAAEKRRFRAPPKPRLSLHDLVFAVDVQNGRGCVATVVSPGVELAVDKNGVFRFDINVGGGSGSGSGPNNVVAFEELDRMTITWNVVLQGMKGVFTMIECRGKGSFVLGLEGWFSKELPSTGCCSGGGASGLVADLRLGMRESGGGKAVVEKISVGVLSIVSWRYVCIEDALRYLQHFLLS